MNEQLIYPIWKPEGISSYDVIREMKKNSTNIKFGHCGTLDPFAEGILIICSGKELKNVSSYMSLQKTYVTEIIFGCETDTLDPTGKIIKNIDVNPVFSISDIEEILNTFKNHYLQSPPYFSAKKINGVRMYKFARQNIFIKPKGNKVNILSYRIIDLDNPYYFAVLLDEDPDKPICNFHFNDENNLKIGIFDKDNKEIKYKLKTVKDLYKFNEQLINIVKIQSEKNVQHEGRFKAKYNTKWGIYSGECIEIEENNRLVRKFDGKGVLTKKDGSIFYGVWKMNTPWNVKHIDKNKKPIFLISNGKKIG